MKAYVLLGCAGLIMAPARAQVVLKADSATAKEVRLSWTGATGKEIRLERRAGPDRWDPVATTTEANAADSKIAPFATYNYRVVSGALTSNVVTVGPPPGGFHTIVPKPANHPDTALGKFISPVLDANGDPAVAFVYADPNGDGRYDDTEIRFVSWDRAAYRWKEPVFVATVGNWDPRPPVPGLAFARDAGSGTYGAAWVDPANKIVHLALSKDGGATWSVKTLLSDPKPVAGPSLVFWGGQAHFTVASDGRNAILYLTGSLEDEPGAWKSSTAPMAPGNTAVSRGSSLALDDAGAPALAYWQRVNNGSLWTLYFWRPGGDAPVKVTDTGTSTYPPDGAILTFAGKQPRILLDSRLDRGQISSHYSTFSNDGGATWSKPVPVPDDGNEHIGGYMSFAVGPGGQAAFAGDVIGGNTQGMKCNWPKLARSADLTAWTTCAPEGAQAYPQVRTLWGTVLYAPSGMLYLVFQNRQTGPQQGLPGGLLIWGGK